MGIKSDRWIIEMSRDHSMIAPFVEEHVTKGLSFGAEGYGYDVRLGYRYKMLRTAYGESKSLAIDPLRINEQDWSPLTEVKQGPIWIEPGRFILAESMERFKIPREALMLMEGKSTYARCGLIINCTPFDPEWEGVATICIVNPTRHSIAVHPGLGIAKALFFTGDDVCALSYADKRGKYMHSDSVATSRT